MIKYYKIVNKYNYDIIQLKIDYNKKVFQFGQFVLHAEVLSKKKFYEKVQELKINGFTEIK